MNIDPNSPAFPTVSASVHLPHHGMTIRAEIASRVMAALLGRTGYEFNHAAEDAVIAADALIAELNATGKDKQ